MSSGEVSWGLVRQYWPILTALFLLIGSQLEQRFTVQQNTLNIIEHEELLNRKVFTEFAVWKTNITRDIQELKRGCNAL